jgi:glycosyltransferase involved in cell wall biosynthesis
MMAKAPLVTSDRPPSPDRSQANATPEVTVLLPHYRCEPFLKDAVESVLVQQGVDLQVWLVDDHSDGTRWFDAIVHLIGDPRLVVFRTSRNVGNYRIKNALLPFVRSPFIAFQDADDISHPSRLRTQVAAIRRTGAGVMGCGFRYMSESGEALGARRMVRNCNVWLRLGKCFVLLHPTSVVRREVFDTLGGFDGSVRIGADDDFMLRAAALYRIRNVQDILYSYRRRPDSLTGSPSTGFDSDVRRTYSATVWKRAAERRRLRDRQALIECLQAPPNDIEFEVARMRPADRSWKHITAPDVADDSRQSGIR